MIINSLTLHNFMSYADARLDLTPVNVACLNGANGAGKSALLDAITWALWESARASSEELVRLGQSEMWVDLCFSLEQQVYRVRRSRRRISGRSGQAGASRGQLDLQIWKGDYQSWFECFRQESGAGNSDYYNGNGKIRGEGESKGYGADHGKRIGDNNGKDESKIVSQSQSTSQSQGASQSSIEAEASENDYPAQRGAWLSLNSASMRETQKQLKELLHMDYDTFVSSVYLRQGRADEFTIRSASERKQVIADILGLDRFEELQALCRQESRECKGRIQMLEASLESSGSFETGLAELSFQLDQLAHEIKELEQELQASKANELELAGELSALQFLELKRQNSAERISQLKVELETIEKRAAELDSGRSKLLLLLERRSQIEAKLAEFEDCKTQAETLDHKSLVYDELISKRSELRSRLAIVQGRMEVELEHFRVDLKSKLSRKAHLSKDAGKDEKLELEYRDYCKLLDAELEMSRRRETHASLHARAEELQALINEARVRLEAQVQQKESLRQEIEQLLDSQSEIALEESRLESDLRDMEIVEAEFELVEERGLKVKSEIELKEQNIAQLKKAIVENEQKVHELCRSPDLSSCPLCRSPIVDAKAVLDRYGLESDQRKREIGEIEAEIEQMSQTRESLRKEYLELRKRLSMRNAIDRRIGEFNERKSALERAQANKMQLSEEIELAKKCLSENSFAPVEKESLIRIKAELAKLDFDPVVFSSFQAQMRSRRGVEIRYQQRARDLKELEEIEEQTSLLEKRIEQLDLELAQKSFAPELQSELALIEEQLATLAYDRAGHKQIKDKLSELLSYAEQSKALKQSETELPILEAALCSNQELQSARLAEFERLQADLLEWNARLADLNLCRQELENAQKLCSDLEEKKASKEKQELVLQTQLSQLKSGQDELDSKKQLLKQNLDAMSDYNLLAEAFGKKGIQAIIIENAIPEIEAEANKILSRLSENRMHLALITQQQSKQGNPIETLEIMIADEIGSRAYELYSGGEAFKVNFALRLAVSRLLARRSGARLETLIIDEGFGSQDEQSRSKVIQAISAIQHEFARVIVVTHISEIKDMFPVQIAVHKEEGVSKLALNV